MSAINTASMIRGADGRLFAVSIEGITEIAETASVATAIRAGKTAEDHEAGRYSVTPGL